MAQVVSAAVLGAALGLAGALLAPEAAAQPVRPPQSEFAGLEDTRPSLPPVPEPDELPAESGGFDEAFFDRREAAPPAVPAADAGPLAAVYRLLLLVLTIGVAALIFVSGVDDAFIDACYWLRRLQRRKTVLRPGALAALSQNQQRAFAIMVPAWKEHDVIAAMIENTVQTLDYRAFGIFCGVYRNDPATAQQVDRMVARYPGQVIRVVVPHDGPTCKADCLNHIVRRVRDEERSSGARYAGMVLHDSEDVIHPRELQLFNALVPRADLIQLPVFSLDRTWRELTAGTYIDDFAECHGKDIAVRESLTGIVPGAGVATCYSRRALEALWRSSAGEPFNTASLTEDYELSFRLRRLGMSLTLAHVDSAAVRARGVRGRTASVIATHEYFPDKFKAAYRQRARWVIGIAFQGWQQLGWRGTAWERYFFFRDRKAMVMAPAGAAAYLLLLNFALIAALGADELLSLLSLPVLQQLLAVNLAFMCNRALQRMYFVARYYGPMHGLLSLARMPVNNLINFFAVMRAWRLFAAHLVTGKKLAWDKTAHVYPDAPTLAPAAMLALRVVAFCCAVFAAAPEYALAAPPPLAGAAYELADEAYRALERGELERALRLATEALEHAPNHASLLLLQADVLVRQGKQADALARIRDLGAADLGGPGLAQRGYLWLGTDNHAAAEADFAGAMAAGGLEAVGRANVAAELSYLALRRNDDAAALNWFEAALASPRPGKSSAGLYADAGYAALRLGRNRLAAEMLSKAVDEWHAAPLANKPFPATALYDMRSSIDTLSRRWSATFSIGHSSTQAAAGTALAANGGDLRVVQAGGEIAYTPERFGYRNERLFQLYASTFQAVSANEEDYAIGADSRIAALGARYKPLPNHNLVLAVERRFAIGSRAGEDDWLLRAGWSAGRGTEWDPARDSWPTWQAYTEGAYFLDASRLVQPFEARIGRSWKLRRWLGAVVTPYLGVAGEYDDAQAPKMAAGVGPGVALRYWFGETRHRAASSYIDFSLQYRARLTDARRGGGLFGQLALHVNF
jgi:bacteriophage N4 adsorption protein B